MTVGHGRVSSMRLTREIAATLGLSNVEALFTDRQPGIDERNRQHAQHRQQEAIVEKIADRAARLTRAEERIRRWFGLELGELVDAPSRDEAIARLRAAVPELAQLASAPDRPEASAPVENEDAEADPAVLMAQMARILNGPGNGRR